MRKTAGPSPGCSENNHSANKVEATQVMCKHYLVHTFHCTTNKLYHQLQMYTRQMMIIAGDEPELCYRRHAKREGGVYAPRMHYVSVSLVQNTVCTCCAYVGKCEKGFV